MLKNVTIKSLAEFKNSNIRFMIGEVLDEAQYVAVAEQGSIRIVLTGDKEQMATFLMNAVEKIMGK